MPPVRWIGSAIARMTLPSGSGGAMLGEVLGHRPAGDGQASPCSSPASSSAFITTGHAADPVDVGHDVAAERLDVGQVRDPWRRSG